MKNNNNEEAFKELRQIPIDKAKHKIRFLINGMKNTEIILREFITILRAEMKKLQTLISEEERIEFYKECFGLVETPPNILRKADQITNRIEPDIIKKANRIIDDFSKKEFNQGKDK
ncbi:unnamed protein product [marine sediment metagenome]|uniref:Uncharacterized protein n=1 Tax=marine sediment metagenome TaxID=412755 RepID=X1G8K3_9ZZZZ